MIRFCDKEVYTIHENQMSRTQMLLFFLDGHRQSVLQLVDEKQKHVGIVTYRELLKKPNEINVCRDKVILDDNFWEEAAKCLGDETKKLIPVFDTDNNILGFCYQDVILHSTLYGALSQIEKSENLPFLFEGIYPRVQQVCIYECNEYAYRLYRILKKYDIPVCVIGEKWNWFGIENFEGFFDYPDYARMNIYAEGTKLVSERDEEFEVDSVEEGFECVVTLAREIFRLYKEQFVHRMSEKSVKVCQVIFPKRKDVSYMTPVEKKSECLAASFYKFIMFPELYSSEMLEVLYEVFGKQVCEDFARKKMISDIGTPEEEIKKSCSNRKIYIIGPCIVVDQGVYKEETLAGNLQKLVGNDYVVISKYVPWGSVDSGRFILNELPVQENDILLFVDDMAICTGKDSRNIPTLSVKDIYNDENRGTWFSDGAPFHINSIGSRKIAEKIYEGLLKEILKTVKMTDVFIQKGEIINADTRRELTEYVASLDRFQIKEGQSTGAIIMNCNPFTLGHQYLIEYASGKVDNLYIFVVEENRSDFTFEERLHMVKEGTKHLSNVRVNPSGRFILSFETLPAYFEKAVKQEAVVDAKTDLHIFGRYVAPELGISCRFVGEEPTDMVTRQYNEQMKEILTLFDIDVFEIPRKMSDGEVISASLVRRLISEKDFEGIKKYVPESTYLVLGESGYLD